MREYKVGKLAKKNMRVEVPGSKSITNRALMIAALAKGGSRIKGILRSDDSRHFLSCLKELGFLLTENGDEVEIRGNDGAIPKEKAKIYVGGAGTAARFLTAMLAMSAGEYEADASEQMRKRPMKDLIAALESIGAEFTFYGEPYAFPFAVKGMGDARGGGPLFLNVNIDKSSQYLSALLMAAPMLRRDVSIRLTGKRSARSYVAITERMMKEFGAEAVRRGEDEYFVGASSSYSGREYHCEPDVSAACYFYAIAAACGASVTVSGIRSDSMQGDIRFLDVLSEMGCSVKDGDGGICVTGPEKLKGVKADMSDFSDQALTLSAIAPFADSEVCITGIGHIRNQESDRIMSMHNELKRMGITSKICGDGIIIEPGMPRPARIRTYNDHRVAMSYAVTGLRAEGIVIEDPECAGKTFPDYFKVLDGICS